MGHDEAPRPRRRDRPRRPGAAVQDDLAAALLRLAGQADDPVVRLTREDRAALEAADAGIARGEFATDAEMRELWTKPIP